MSQVKQWIQYYPDQFWPTTLYTNSSGTMDESWIGTLRYFSLYSIPLPTPPYGTHSSVTISYWMSHNSVGFGISLKFNSNWIMEIVKTSAVLLASIVVEWRRNYLWGSDQQLLDLLLIKVFIGTLPLHHHHHPVMIATEWNFSSMCIIQASVDGRANQNNELWKCMREKSRRNG